jgi:DNA-directed RNA polymerase subunit K/omega
MLAEPVSAQRQDLIDLARQAMKRALMLNDGPVACFVLEEEACGRDPAVTIAEGVLASCARDARPPSEPPASGKPRHTRAPRHPLRRMMERGAARMREDVAVEEALRHAARAAADPPERSTAVAARRALALRHEAPVVVPPVPPSVSPACTLATEPASPAPVRHPKLPQAP